MKKYLSKNILIPILLGSIVGIANMVLYKMPLLHLMILPAILVPLSIGQHRRYSFFTQWIIVLISVFLWLLIEFAIAYLSQYHSWAEYVFYFPFYNSHN